MRRNNLVPAVMLAAIAAMTSSALADVIYYGEALAAPEPTFRIVRALSDGSVKQVVVTQSTSVSSIALDTSSGKMYWLSQDGIRRADLDGSGIEHIVTDSSGTDLEIDTLGGKIYWRGGTIERSNLDGSNVELILDPPSLSVGGIAVHGPSGKLFWADNNYPLDDEIPNMIHRADLDGTNAETILALDEWLKLTNVETNPDDPDSRLFWFQWVTLGTGATGLASSNLDGSNYTPLDVEATFEFPPLSVTDDKVYWTITPCGDVCFPSWIYRASHDGGAEQLLFEADGIVSAMDVDDTSSSLPVPALSGRAGVLLVAVLLVLSSALLLRRRRPRRDSGT